MINNIYENLKYSKDAEIIDLIDKAKNIEISRITSSGQTTDWLEDSRYEIAILLEGEAVIEFSDHKVKLKKGEVIKITPHTKHRVYNLSPTGLWLAIYITQ